MENNIVNVMLWDEEVGKLYWDERNRRAIFNYHPDFVKKGLEIAPLTASVKGGQQKVCLYPAIRINSIRDCRRFWQILCLTGGEIWFLTGGPRRTVSRNVCSLR